MKWVSRVTTILIGLMGLVVAVVFIFLTAGIKPMYVVSESMEPTFFKGDMVLKVDNNLVEPGVGDVVAFKAPWLDNKIVTHRVLEISEDSLITKGDNNLVADPLGSPDQLVGVIIGKIPWMGWLISPWAIRIIAFSLLVIIIIEVFMGRFFNKATSEGEELEVSSNQLDLVTKLRSNRFYD